MPDIASIAEVIRNVHSDEHGDLIEHSEEIAPATLTDLCDLIESGSEEERVRLTVLLWKIKDLTMEAAPIAGRPVSENE